MRIVLLKYFLIILAAGGISSCETIKNLPTNTTSGLFSLNGSWKLASTTDNNALVGSLITVYPLVGNAMIKTINYNTYCLRENDEIWKSIKSTGSGGFTLSLLVNACNNTKVYKEAVISIVTNDKVTVTSRTAGNNELIQAWDRIKQ